MLLANVASMNLMFFKGQGIQPPFFSCLTVEQKHLISLSCPHTAIHPIGSLVLRPQTPTEGTTPLSWVSSLQRADCGT